MKSGKRMGGVKRMGGGKRMGGRKEWEKWNGAMKARQTAHHDGEDNTDLLNNFEDAEHS